MDYINGFSNIELLLNPWDEAYLIMMNDNLIGSQIEFAQTLLNISALMLMREIGLKFSFFVRSLCVLGMSITGASKNELGSVPSVSFL